MGSYSSLLVGNVCIDSLKSSLVVGDFLFCYEDKQKRYLAGYNKNDYALTRKLQSVLPRLELEGYTLKSAEKILKYELSHIDYPITYDNLIQKLITIDFSNNGSYENIDKLIYGDFFNSIYLDTLALLRILIEILKDQDIDISLDYIELYRGGWIKRKFLSAPDQFLILTEGKTDTDILKLSLKKIYPYIAPYFRFANMEESPFGGTTNLVKFIKGLNSIDYKGNVLAIFDNDVAGNAAMLEVPKTINSNIKVMSLPKHKKFSKFNTLGVSNKIVRKNINGNAVAIECFLDIPEDAFVRWVSYDEKLKKYQGCFDNHYKKKYYTEFINAVNSNETNYNYEMLIFLWDKIIKEVVKIKEKSLSYGYSEDLW